MADKYLCSFVYWNKTKQTETRKPNHPRLLYIHIGQSYLGAILDFLESDRYARLSSSLFLHLRHSSNIISSQIFLN